MSQKILRGTSDSRSYRDCSSRQCPAEVRVSTSEKCQQQTESHGAAMLLSPVVQQSRNPLPNRADLTQKLSRHRVAERQYVDGGHDEGAGATDHTIPIVGFKFV